LISVTLILMVLSLLLRASSLWTWYGPYDSQTPVIGGGFNRSTQHVG
jgi:hypothetical protein